MALNPKKKVPAAKKPSRKLEIQGYIFKIQAWIIEGKTSVWIIGEAKRLKWCKSDRNVERWINTARLAWAQEQNSTIEVKRIQKIEELKAMKLTLKPKHRGTPAGIEALLKIDRDIRKLEGLGTYTGFIKDKEGDTPQAPQVHAVDYNQLSPEVLKQIHNARPKRAI